MTDKKKGRFMKIIIIYCLTFMAVTNIWALFILQKTGYNASSIINAINLVHGGELLLCCLKKILESSDSKTKLTDKLTTKLTKNYPINNENKNESFEMTDEFKNNHSDLRG